MTQREGRSGDAASAPGFDARGRRIVIAIWLVAVAARLALLGVAEIRPGLFDFPDSHRYLLVGRNIAEGRGAIDSNHVRAGTDPVLPSIIAAGIRAGFDSEAALRRFVRVVNVLCSLASVALVYLLGRTLVDHHAAAWAALILAVDPLLLYFNGLVLTETVFVMMLLASILLIATARQTAGPAHAGLAGAFMGLAILTRSTALGLPLLLIPCLWNRRALSIGRRMVLPIVFLSAVVVVLAPRLVRNHRLLGAWTVLRTGAGASLLEAFGPWADGSPGMDRIRYPAVDAGASEIERDRAYRRTAVDWARSHSAEALRLAGVKLRRTWTPLLNAEQFDRPIFQVIALTATLPIYLLAGLGVWGLRGRLGAVWMLLAPAAYFTFVHMVFVGSVRYRLPVMPMLFVLSAAALARLVGPREGGPTA